MVIIFTYYIKTNLPVLLEDSKKKFNGNNKYEKRIKNNKRKIFFEIISKYENTINIK